MTVSLSELAANVQLTALSRLFDGGFLRVYTGPRPQSPDEPINEQRLLAEVRFSSPAFRKPKNGYVRSREIEPDPHAAPEGDGEASWYRVFAADGETALIDGTVGTHDADMLVSSTTIQRSAKFSIMEYRLRPSHVVFHE